jgi:hypothetical protein
MKRYALIVFVLWMSVFPLVVGKGFAADSLSFSESYKQKAACVNIEGEQFCGVADTGKFKISAKISLSGIDINQFNEETYLSIELAGFFFEAILGDDPDYTPGVKHAKFVYSDEFVDPITEEISNIDYLVVSLKWTNNHLTVTASGKTAPYFFINSILAGNYVGVETGPIEDVVDAAVDSLGEDFEVFVVFDINITGKVTTKTVHKGEEDFDVSTISLKGKGIPVVEE